MVIKMDISLKDFNAWQGGRDTLESLTSEQLEQLEVYFEEIYDEQEIPTDTDLNDFLWFERDFIAEVLGFEDWEHLEDYNNN